jgi:hypothetical protein
VDILKILGGEVNFMNMCPLSFSQARVGSLRKTLDEYLAISYYIHWALYNLLVPKSFLSNFFKFFFFSNGGCWQ